jgi:hypothetical protein
VEDHEEFMARMRALLGYKDELDEQKELVIQIESALNEMSEQEESAEEEAAPAESAEEEAPAVEEAAVEESAPAEEMKACEPYIPYRWYYPYPYWYRSLLTSSEVEGDIMAWKGAILHLQSMITDLKSKVDNFDEKLAPFGIVTDGDRTYILKTEFKIEEVLRDMEAARKRCEMYSRRIFDNLLKPIYRL